LAQDDGDEAPLVSEGFEWHLDPSTGAVVVESFPASPLGEASAHGDGCSSGDSGCCGGPGGAPSGDDPGGDPSSRPADFRASFSSLLLHRALSSADDGKASPGAALDHRANRTSPGGRSSASPSSPPPPSPPSVTPSPRQSGGSQAAPRALLPPLSPPGGAAKPKPSRPRAGGRLTGAAGPPKHL